MAYLNGHEILFGIVGQIQYDPIYQGNLPLDFFSVGGNLSDWTIYGNTEGVGEKQIVKGNLPLNFVSDGTTLENYRIYGTADGAGVQTENQYTIPLTVTSGTESKNTDIPIGDSKLLAKEYVDYGEQKVYKRTENKFDKDDCGMIQVTAQGAMRFGTEVEGLTAGTYTLSFNNTKTTKIYIEIRDNEGNYSSVGGDVTSPYTFSLAKAPAALIVRTNISSDSSSWKAAGIENMMLTEGSAPPETYIPYLQPTNPPLPLPAIETFNGTNTLESMETLGETTITQGYIVPLDIHNENNDKHMDIYIGDSPLTEGQSVSKSSTGIEIEVGRGQNVIDTTLENKPEMSVVPDSYVKLKQIAMNNNGSYNETQSDFIIDNVEEVTQ